MMVAKRAARSFDFPIDHAERYRRAFLPGGPGDRVVFGYMFRVVAALASVVVPVCALLILGAFNGWRLTEGMIGGFVLVSGLMILAGEGIRSAVYERHMGRGELTLPQVDVSEKDLIHTDVASIRASLSYRLMKRLVDLVIAFPALIAVGPLLVVVGLMIKFDSEGPIFVKDLRIGRSGQVFNLFKFRTLYRDAEEVPETVDLSSKSITRVGSFLRRTSLDILPMLFNVLSGDMSFVGPRPHRLDSVEDEDAELMFAFWSVVKPGIVSPIGPWRHDDFKADKLLLLRDYLRRRSVLLDIKIMVEAISDLMVRRSSDGVE